MFARPIHRTPDMIKQHEYLEDITKNIELGHYQPTTTQVLKVYHLKTYTKHINCWKTINDWKISN